MDQESGGATAPRGGPKGVPGEPPPAESFHSGSVAPHSGSVAPTERSIPPTRWAEIPPTRQADGGGPDGGAEGGPDHDQWAPDEVRPWSAASADWQPGGPPAPGYPLPDHPEAGYPVAGHPAPARPWPSRGDGEVPVPPAGGEPPAAVAPPPGPPRRRRRWVRVAIAAAVVLGLLVAADRAAVGVAEDQMAKQIKASVLEGLECGVPEPTVRDVSIGGFPFLTQILFGRFKDIGVTIEGIPTPGPRISWVQARLAGIHVPFGDMVSGNVGAVPVDDIRAAVRLDYSDLNTYLAGLPGEIQVNPVDGGRRIEISGRVDLPLIGAQEVGGVTTFEVRNNVLTLVPSEITLRGGINLSIPLPGGSLLPSIPIPVGQLPLDLNVVEASSGAEGLSLTATAYDVVLPKTDEVQPRQCPAGGGTGPS